MMKENRLYLKYIFYIFINTYNWEQIQLVLNWYIQNVIIKYPVYNRSGRDFPPNFQGIVLVADLNDTLCHISRMSKLKIFKIIFPPLGIEPLWHRATTTFLDYKNYNVKIEVVAFNRYNFITCYCSLCVPASDTWRQYYDYPTNSVTAAVIHDKGNFNLLVNDLRLYYIDIYT